MRFTFDPKKDKVNQEKHGLSLSAANEFDWDDALTWVDVRKKLWRVTLYFFSAYKPALVLRGLC
jgi:uncharacterized DUF497 family protein